MRNQERLRAEQRAERLRAEQRAGQEAIYGAFNETTLLGMVSAIREEILARVRRGTFKVPPGREADMMLIAAWLEDETSESK